MIAIHAIILTLDEEQHIRRCIESVKDQCTSITVVDCGSSDRTTEVARSLGANIIVNRWINYATQLNFAINVLAGRGGWLLRVDADEVLDRDSRHILSEAIDAVPPDVNGILVQRRIHFLGRRIRHGTIEPSWQLRLWRNGTGRCEQRWMDEHIKVEGRVEKSGLVLSDINLNSLTWWTTKHNSYASREAVDILNARHGFMPHDELRGGASVQAKMKRWVKEKLYLRLPPGLRASYYFTYRYVFRLGFLDGVEGYYFHSLQGYWYRTLVDAKVNEIERAAKERNISIIEAICDRTGIDPLAFTSHSSFQLPVNAAIVPSSYEGSRK